MVSEWAQGGRVAVFLEAHTAGLLRQVRAVILLEPEVEQRVVVECQFGARRSRRAWDYDAMALAEVLGDCSKGMLPLRPVRAWTYDFERGAFNPVSAESVTCVSFCMGG
jgi:hypothetical protein